MKKYDYYEIEDAFKMFSAFVKSFLIEPIGPSIYKQQILTSCIATVATVRDQPPLSQRLSMKVHFSLRKS